MVATYNPLYLIPGTGVGMFITISEKILKIKEEEEDKDSEMLRGVKGVVSIVGAWYFSKYFSMLGLIWSGSGLALGALGFIVIHVTKNHKLYEKEPKDFVQIILIHIAFFFIDLGVYNYRGVFTILSFLGVATKWNNNLHSFAKKFSGIEHTWNDVINQRLNGPKTNDDPKRAASDASGEASGEDVVLVAGGSDDGAGVGEEEEDK